MGTGNFNKTIKTARNSTINEITKNTIASAKKTIEQSKAENKESLSLSADYYPQSYNVSKYNSVEDSAIINEIAEAFHDAWALGRQAEGWQYGPKRDELLKTHPNLVHYSKLPETEKDYDRVNARLAYLVMENSGRLKPPEYRDVYSLTWQEWRCLLSSEDEIGQYYIVLRHINEFSSGINKEMLDEFMRFFKNDSQMTKVLNNIGLKTNNVDCFGKSEANINSNERSCFYKAKIPASILLSNFDGPTLTNYIATWLDLMNQHKTVVVCDYSRIIKDNNSLWCNIFSVLNAIEKLVKEAQTRDVGKIVTGIVFEEGSNDINGMIIKISYFRSGNGTGSGEFERITKYNEKWPYSNRNSESIELRTSMKEFLMQLASAGAAVVARKTADNIAVLKFGSGSNYDDFSNVSFECKHYGCKSDNAHEIFNIFIPSEKYKYAFERKTPIRVADLVAYNVDDAIIQKLFPEINLEASVIEPANNEIALNHGTDNKNCILVIDCKLRGENIADQYTSGFLKSKIEMMNDVPDENSELPDIANVIVLHVNNDKAAEFYNKLPEDKLVILVSTASLTEDMLKNIGFDTINSNTKLLPCLSGLKGYEQALSKDGAIFNLIECYQHENIKAHIRNILHESKYYIRGEKKRALIDADTGYSDVSNWQDTIFFPINAVAAKLQIVIPSLTVNKDRLVLIRGRLIAALNALMSDTNNIGYRKGLAVAVVELDECLQDTLLRC